MNLFSNLKKERGGLHCEQSWTASLGILQKNKICCLIKKITKETHHFVYPPPQSCALKMRGRVWNKIHLFMHRNCPYFCSIKFYYCQHKHHCGWFRQESMALISYNETNMQWLSTTFSWTARRARWEKNIYIGHLFTESYSEAVRQF